MQCGNCHGVGSTPTPLNVFNPLVALVYFSLGSDVNVNVNLYSASSQKAPLMRSNVTRQITRNVNNTEFSCQLHMGFKAQNAPKPVFGRTEPRTPLGELTTLPQTS